ncbi:hypothetical protein KSP39_PZI005978 [Platanthera zijinensis]|uniref:Retrotransposon gag domain-containing protein n=1 Tax=Platanthera zijinensis TaxID=2320716 RepID=A0AAP0GAT3_9ASPA
MGVQPYSSDLLRDPIDKIEESTNYAELVNVVERLDYGGLPVYEFEYTVDSTRGGMKRIFAAAFISSKKLCLLNISYSDRPENPLDGETRGVLKQILHSFESAWFELLGYNHGSLEIEDEHHPEVVKTVEEVPERMLLDETSFPDAVAIGRSGEEDFGEVERPSESIEETTTWMAGLVGIDIVYAKWGGGGGGRGAIAAQLNLRLDGGVEGLGDAGDKGLFSGDGLNGWDRHCPLHTLLDPKFPREDQLGNSEILIPSIQPYTYSQISATVEGEESSARKKVSVGELPRREAEKTDVFFIIGASPAESKESDHFLVDPNISDLLSERGNETSFGTEYSTSTSTMADGHDDEHAPATIAELREEFNGSAIFEWHNLMDVEKVRLARMKVLGRAKTFLLNEERSLGTVNGAPPIGWAAMKALLNDQYVPAYHRTQMFDELATLCQGGQSVVEYMGHLKDMMVHCDIREMPEVTLSRFRKGLNMDIQGKLLRYGHTDLNTTFNATLDIEKHNAYKSKGRAFQKGKSILAPPPSSSMRDKGKF